MRRTPYHKSISLLFDIEAARAKIAARVVRDPETGCHNWVGSNSQGYGQISIEGRTWSTHRLCYEIENGPIPPFEQCRDGKYCVLHRCDNPSCCNPEHLYLGSMADNSRDMADRARMRVGHRIDLYRTGVVRDPNKPAGTVFWEVDGQIRRLSEWATLLGVNPCSLDGRLRAGWPIAALSLPSQTGNKFLYGRASYRRFSGEQAVRDYQALGDPRAKTTAGGSLQAEQPAVVPERDALQGGSSTHGS